MSENNEPKVSGVHDNRRAFQNVLEAIGSTPLVKLNHCVPKSAHQYWAKLEYTNPGGSVKDRMALYIIEQAEKRGDLKPGGTIVEATSGNTGVGLGMVAAVKGYKCVFTIPSKMSDEKINTLRAFGAEVIVTPSGVEPDDPRSHYSVAREIVRTRPNSYLANQYNNPDNPLAHVQTTGPELWTQLEGKVDVFVDGAGTGGTLTGTGRYLKSKNPNAKIVCADPFGSILHDLFYFKEVRTPPVPYLVEGIGEDMLPDNVDMKLMDDFIQVTDQAAFSKTREILRTEGLFVGPSSGTSLAGAIQYVEKVEAKAKQEGKTLAPMNIVVLFPDSGSKYLSKVFNDAWMKEKGLL